MLIYANNYAPLFRHRQRIIDNTCILSATDGKYLFCGQLQVLSTSIELETLPESANPQNNYLVLANLYAR